MFSISSTPQNLDHRSRPLTRWFGPEFRLVYLAEIADGEAGTEAKDFPAAQSVLVRLAGGDHQSGFGGAVEDLCVFLLIWKEL